MKCEIGYITAWRRAIFFVLVLDIIIFGTASTIASSVIGGIAANVISVAALMLCAVLFVLVLADKLDRYRDVGTAVIEDGVLTYNDRKRHIDVKLSDIRKLDIEKINMGRYDGPATAYRLLIKTDKRKYYIESDRACGRSYEEMGINDLYLYIAKGMKADR